LAARPVEEATSPEDVMIFETPAEGNTEDQESDASSDDEKPAKCSAKKSKSNLETSPATPVATSNINKYSTPSTKEIEKEKKADA